MSRSVTSLLHLSAGDVRALVAAALAPARLDAVLHRRVVAVLDDSPGPLPAAAWIAAAGRLGATVVRTGDLGPDAADPFVAAAAAARWCDVLVVSHPLAGFARAVAEATGRPVVNAGESGGECPAAGISLLAGVWPDGPPLLGRGLRAAVCGDLAESPSARAFLAALAAVDATLLLVPARGQELPEAQVQRLARRLGRAPLRFEAHATRSLLDMVDTVLLGPDASPQLPLFRDVGVPPDESARRIRREVEDLDVLLVAGSGGAPDRLVREPFRGTPSRIGQGVEHAVSGRVLEALLEFAAGAATDPADAAAPADPGARYRSGLGLACRGDRCVAARHGDSVAPDFAVVARAPLVLECLYCGERTQPEFAASKVERRFHPVASADAGKILPANLVLFASRGEALATGFEPARRRGGADGAVPPTDAGAPGPAHEDDDGGEAGEGREVQG